MTTHLVRTGGLATAVAIVAAAVALAVFESSGAGPHVDSCPDLGPLEDVNFTAERIAQVHDNAGKSAEIDLNRDYASCKSPQLTATQAQLRKSFAHGEAVLCGQRQAYLAGTYNPPPSLGLKQDAQTRATVAADLADKCDPQKSKDPHWGISLEEA